MSGLVLELGYLALYTVELPLDLCFSWSSFGIFVSTTERWVRLVLAMEVSIDTKTFTSINFSADMSIDIDTKLGDLTLAAPVQLPPPPPVHDRDPWPKEREGDPIPHFAHFDNPSTAVKSTECLNREIRDEWDNYDNMFYNEWLKVSIEPTRFVDPDVIRHMGIREDLEDMFVELGKGNMATNPHVLYPQLVRQFIAMVQVYYGNKRVKRANEGTLTFFIRSIHYRVPLMTLSTIYGFQNSELQRATVPRAAMTSTSTIPAMPDMSTHPEGDFQRIVVDALTAIWARVSRCRCSSRASVRAS
ncbi:hypothetical protein F2Q68_00004646 [Brassica cretica]|uniref:Arabidopsis retrotransposon Orf1 C-terminal domain-containing protein n=1 Tax=Brassica cretica TaxID=69181 RepID=A0A8S9J5U0_BRACR|nr:hypothetical protein F2Q68_00004646 [Brassica cretica]